MRTTAGSNDAPYMKTFLLTVKVFTESGAMKGECMEFGSTEPIRFQGCFQMLEVMEYLLNKPVVSLPNEPPAPKNLPGTREAAASFRITVYFRQHSSWQGTILWIEQGRKYTFRSALELLKFLNAALRPRTENTEVSCGARAANSGKKGIDCFE